MHTGQGVGWHMLQQGGHHWSHPNCGVGEGVGVRERVVVYI